MRINNEIVRMILLLSLPFRIYVFKYRTKTWCVCVLEENSISFGAIPAVGRINVRLERAISLTLFALK